MPPSGTGAPTAPASMSLPSSPCSRRRVSRNTTGCPAIVRAFAKTESVALALQVTFCRAAARCPSRWGPRFSRMSATYVYDTSWKLGVAAAPACVCSGRCCQAETPECGVLGVSSAQSTRLGHTIARHWNCSGTRTPPRTAKDLSTCALASMVLLRSHMNRLQEPGGSPNNTLRGSLSARPALPRHCRPLP